MAAKTKTCSKCGYEGPPEEFYRGQCRPCLRAWQKAYRAKTYRKPVDATDWTDKVRRIYMEFVDRGDGWAETMSNLFERFNFLEKGTIQNMVRDLEKPEPMPKNVGIKGGGDFATGISFGKGFAVRNGEIIA